MRILLIEDDQTLSRFIIKGLKEAGYSVENAHDGMDGLDLAINDNFDLAIIDIMLPRLDGLSIIKRMRQEQVNLPVIILSAKRSIDDRITGLQQGSDDYLVKPFSFSELLARVQALLRRAKNEVEPTTLRIDGLAIDLLTREVTRDGKRIDLQPKEFALLEYLIRNKGHVVTKNMITERVWNYNFDPQTNIVEARISTLREKIDKDFDYPLLQTRRGMGYVMKRADD